MEILKGILIVVELVISLLLILIILVQPSKSGGGLGGAAFGGGMGEQLFGARTGNVLTKGTILFSVIFVVNTLVLALLYAHTGRRSTSFVPPPVVEQAQGLPAQALPETPAAAPAPEALPPGDQAVELPIDTPETGVVALPIDDVPVAVPEAAAPAPAPVVVDAPPVIVAPAAPEVVEEPAAPEVVPEPVPQP